VKHRSIARLAISVCIGGASVALYACSEAPLDPNTGGGLTGGTTNSGGTAGTLAAGTAGTGTSGSTSATGGTGTAGTGVVIPTDASADVMEDVDLTEDAACGTGSADASLQPVSMMVMFDRSTSMEEIADEDTGASRWNLASAALTTFFQDPAAADLGVALRFFPHDSPMVGCTADGCEADEDNGLFDYPTATAACQQVLVDMGTLLADPADPHEVALTNAITASAPDRAQGTPIYAALGGALEWAKVYQTAHPEQKTVVIFVTDGEANGCNTDPDDIAQLAADALAEANINTYAIGLTGASEADMNQLAEAGGTMMSYFIDDGATATADLLAALNAIRGMALSCDFPMPTATDAGMAIDPERVNVTYTASATGVETTFSKVTDASQCGTTASWYYDDNVAPTRIFLCPAACDAVKADADAKLDILVGCKTIIEPPK
jgi:hypothetical protein